MNSDLQTFRPDLQTGPQATEITYKKIGMATPAGFEPATTRLEGECSIQLSYGVVDLMEY